MYPFSLGTLLFALGVFLTPGVKLTRPLLQGEDASLADVLGAYQSLKNTVTFWTRQRGAACGFRPKELAVHLSTPPNTGTTWVQYVFEEATGIITQRNPDNPLGSMPECRCKFGVSSSVARLAFGDELELYKAHYPGLPGATEEMVNGMSEAQTIFVPANKMFAVTRSLLIVRNPIDAFFAIGRHLSATDDGKVGASAGETVSLHSRQGPLCASDETETRPELVGKWEDPDGYNANSNISTPATSSVDVFRNYLKLWDRFVAYWFMYKSSECFDVTMVRYEDLIDADRNFDTFKVLVSAFDPSVSSHAIMRGTLTYPPRASSSSYNVYVNASFDADITVQAFAHVCLEQSELMSALGYDTFLERIVS